ncbi:hypothetical protein AMAG_13686 [Allomyces macrogynus ATCC 38327]|uniref:Uncharacterized protein n=1 Tax=Allomyces macrogynus (strain ATCC 38327) TaxID=578462 RepID=A0A0L0T412_ALLM3|nr:hypothetical protein AMAG_13686 [Allomyces macrogynus ATCC 38327]|eukprot:KNE69309.1 hypothetical protein AMAG_13686 [Allomyces macrogynus ATCC 38327]
MILPNPATPSGEGLLTTFLIDVGIQLATWAISSPLKTEKFYDLSGSITYIACFLNALLNRGDGASLSSLHPRQIIAVIFCLIWCSRLGLFLFRRVLREGKDHRFDDIKVAPFKFLFAFVAQIAWVWFTGLAVFIVAANPSATQPNINALDVIGIIWWVVSFAIEAVADYQKNKFKNANPTKFITTGLWAYSRHPNYFGEVMLWIGMFLLCATGFVEPWQWVGLLSPTFVFFLLYFGSGVRLLEQSSDKRYGHLPEYQEYKARTSIFVLWPPKKAGGSPLRVAADGSNGSSPA